MSSFGKPLKLVEPGRWGNMSTEEVRKILGRRAVGEDVIMAVLVGLGMWRGLEVSEDGSVTLNSNEFRAWISCLCNRVLDEEACHFIKKRLKVEIQPKERRTQLELPEKFRDNHRLRAARQEAALLNYGRMAEEEAKRNWRANVKRRREELEEEEAPPARRVRWDSEDEVAIEEIPDFYEDCCNHCWVKLSVPCHPDRAECNLCGRYRTNPKNGGRLRMQDTIRRYRQKYLREHGGREPVIEPYHVVQQRNAEKQRRAAAALASRQRQASPAQLPSARSGSTSSSVSDGSSCDVSFHVPFGRSHSWTPSPILPDLPPPAPSAPVPRPEASSSSASEGNSRDVSFHVPFGRSRSWTPSPILSDLPPLAPSAPVPVPQASSPRAAEVELSPVRRRRRPRAVPLPPSPEREDGSNGSPEPGPSRPSARQCVVQ